jgi:WD40 repeat protein
LRRWDLATGQQLGEPFTGHDDQISAVVISADGSQAVNGGADRTLRLSDLLGGNSIDITALNRGTISCAIANGPDGFQVLNSKTGLHAVLNCDFAALRGLKPAKGDGLTTPASPAQIGRAEHHHTLGLKHQ